jgi:hypothetical protein
MFLRPLPCVAGAVFMLALTAEGVHAQGKSREQPLEVMIDEYNAPVGSDQGRVLPDHHGKTYTDYRALDAPGKCVEMTADVPFLRFNRHYPDSSTRDFEYCEKADGGAYYEQKRQFWIEIPDAAACEVFIPATGPLPDLTPGSNNDFHVRQPFAYWINGGTACRVNGSDKPRVGVENAFKAKLNTRTDVKFMILSYDSTTAFEVHATARVTGGSTTRTFINDGTAPVTLIRNSNQFNVPNTTIATFSLPFKLTLTKVTAAP